MPLFSREIGIDLGTLNTVIAEGHQLLLQEPTVAAIITEEMKMVEWGQAAKDMVGRVPESIEVVRPLKNGTIAEYEITENLLKFSINKVCGSMLVFRPRILITIPCGITSVERRAVHEVGLGTNCRDVMLIEQPLAAAIGIDLPIAAPSGNMIICLGGGLSQAAVLAMNGVVTSGTTHTAGLKLDEAIQSYIRRKYGVIIGQPTAEQIKTRIGSAVQVQQSQSMEIQGQDQVSGLPKPVLVTTEDIVDALQDPLKDIAGMIRKVLEKTPPELISDIIDRGVALCGGTALLRGIDKYLTKTLGIPSYMVDEPTICTALGAAKAITNRETLRRSIIQG